MRAISVPLWITCILGYTNDEKTALTIKHYNTLLKGSPDVSVVIPAYNEEENILNALVSISANITRFSVQIIVVNNNSVDNTESMVRLTGVTCINETRKGVTAARTAGLMAAAGKYILNADADSIYAADWIETMISPLAQDENIALTYGRFSFLPGPGNSRFSFFLYENMADTLRWYKRNFKEEAVYVYGCSSGFRKEQCLAVNAYEHPPGSNEDGYLALKLREKGLGKLKYISDSNVIVWTVDRHLQQDGGLGKAFIKRIKGAIFGHYSKRFQ